MNKYEMVKDLKAELLFALEERGRNSPRHDPQGAALWGDRVAFLARKINEYENV